MPTRHLPRTALTVISFAFLMALAASGQTLYDNGRIDGEVDAFTINFGFAASDTFTISSGQSTVNGLMFGAWLFPGDVLASVDIQITSGPLGGGTSYFNQNVSFTQAGCSGNQYGFNVCTETASFNGPTLDNGTYWVNLDNAVVSDGDPVYWDENSGIGCNSPGCPSQAEYTGVGSIPSESFTILGTNSGTSSVPEPGSLLLLTSGFLALVGRRHKFWS